MRQVFTSLRIETVEGVAKLLQEAGIDIYLANGRSYHSKRSGQFSYAEPMKLKQQPSVWVKRAEDQPRARELLRDAGLFASTRPGQGDPLLFAGVVADERPKRSLAWKIRVGLLIAVAIAALATVLRHRSAQDTVAARPVAPPAAEAPAAGPGPAEPLPQDDDEVRVRITPPAPRQP